MVGFLSQNYITLHNNLVNMIVLLEYFPTSVSVCIWNKLHTSFYLKHVMNMLFFKILNKVWFVTEGHCSSLGASRDKFSLILVIKIYVYLNSKLEGVEHCVAQTIVEDEGATRSQRWVG